MKKRKESEPISSEKNLQQGLKTEGEVSAGKGIERGVENGRERKADERDANAPADNREKTPAKKRGEKTADAPEKKHGFRLSRFFEKPDFKDEENFLRLGRGLLFGILVFVEILILLQQAGRAVASHKWWWLAATLGVEAVLTISEAIKLFAVKGFRNKVYCYVIDFVAAFVLTGVTGSTFLSTLYVIVLTEFYLSSEKILPSAVLCVLCMAVYVVTFGASNWFLYGESVSVLPLLSQCFNDLLILVIHFVFVNLAVRFYRQYVRLGKALKALDQSKAELQKAYDDLAEVTLLEERQRIAKDIHDTAGHSMTTVIMQTEAAKLIIDKNPEEAKS